MLHKKLLTVLAISGLILFIGSIGFVFYRPKTVPNTSTADHVLWFQDPSAVNQSGVCYINWQVTSYSASMMEGDQQALTVSVNNSCSFKVQADFDLEAFTFDVIQPDRMFSLDPDASRSISWLVRANRNGDILVNGMFSSQNGVGLVVNKDSETLKISVTTTFGLNPQLLQWLPYLGTFLGPMLTAPWWYEQWQKYREKKQAEGASDAASSPKSQPAKKRKYARSHR